MKNAGRRLLSMLLIVIMVLGMVPAGVMATDCSHENLTEKATYQGDETHRVQQVCGDCGEAMVSGEAFTVDFMADAKRMSELDAWDQMQVARYYNPQKGAYENVPDARFIGSGVNTAQAQAAAELHAWVEENCNWRLGNLNSIFSDSKRITLNAGDDLQWGLRLWTIYIATGNSGSQTVFYIDVPKAGTYDLELSTFLEDGSINFDGGNAGGTIDLYVNGTPVLQGHSFKGNNEVEDLTIEDVVLQEGENAFMFYTVKDKNGYSSGYGDAGIPLRYMAFTPASSYAEECSDENDDRICDVCGGLLPVTEEDLIPEGMIIVDFKAAAEKMSRKAWWGDLRSAKNIATGGSNAAIKGVGRHNSVGNMTGKEKTAYGELLAWLSKNQSWNIDEEQTRLRDDSVTKRVLFNTGEEDWGLRLSTGALNTADHTSRVYLTVDAETEGSYTMDLLLYRENKALNYDGSNGGGIVSVYVNDQLVLENYATLGNNETVVLSLGNVQLQEGENSVVFHCIGDMKGNTHFNGGDSERAVALRGMVFTMNDGQGLVVPEQAVPAPGAEAFCVDFKGTVKEMVKQPWWENLGNVTNMATATYVAGLKGVGRYNNASMSMENQEAYDAMLAWLAGHANWTIHEEKTSLRGEGESRRMIFNGTNTDWGIRMHTALLNTEDTASRVQLLVTAPVGGVYELDLTVFKQAQQPNWDGGNGGGYASIYVGDKKVLDNYYFMGENETVQIPVGEVELQEGDNVVTIHFISDMKGKDHTNGADSERSIALCDMTFTPVHPSLQLVKNTAYRYDLHGSFLDENAQITEVVSSNEEIVTAEADEEGNVVFCALGRGEAEVTIKDGESETVIPVIVKSAEVQMQNITMTEGEDLVVWADGIAATAMTHQVKTSNSEMVKAQIYGGGVKLEALKPGFARVILQQGGDDACIINVLVEKYVEPVPTAKKIPLDETVSGEYTYDFAAIGNGTYRLWLTMEGDCVGDIAINGETMLEGMLLHGEVSLGEAELSKHTNTLTIITDGEAKLTQILMVPVSGCERVQVMQAQRAVIDLRDGYLAADTEIEQDTYWAHSTDETVATAAFNTDGELKIYGHTPGTAEILIERDDMTVCFVEVEVLAREGEIPEAEPVVMDFMGTAREMAQQPWWNDLKATDLSTMKVIGHHPDGWLGNMDETQQAAYEQMLTWLDENKNWNFDESRSQLSNTDYVKSVTLNSAETAQYGLLFYSAKYLNGGDKSSLYFTVEAAATGEYFMELSAYHAIGSYVNVNNVCAGGIADIYLNGEKIREKYSFAADPAGVITVNLGVVELDEGENVLQFDILSDRFGGTNNSDRAPALRSVTFRPVQALSVADYTKKTVNLNENFLPFDEKVSYVTHRAVSSNEDIVKAEIGRNGLLDLEGVDVGEAKVQILRGEKVLCTIDVCVTEYDGDIDGLGGNTVKADLSTMTVDIPADGLYAMQVQGEGNGSLLVDGVSVYSDLVLSGNRNLGAVSLTKGLHTITVQGDAEVQSIVFVPLGTWTAEKGRTLYLTLTESYFAFDADVSALSVTCENPDVVTASFDEDRDLVLSCKKLGTAKLTVSGGKLPITMQVKVVQPQELKEISYTLDGFEAATLPVGTVCIGDVSGVTLSGTTVEEKQLRKEGAVYFTSSDISVATVDQTTGNVTCVGEGAVTITAYALLDGITKTAQAALVVTDDTDLASIEIKSEQTYLGVGNSMTLTANGLKSSGVKADMSLYPVSWSVDDEAIAVISEDGRLTAVETGTVTVTATAGVQRRAVVGMMQITVVSDEDLASGDIYLDFANERVNNLKTATLEQDGMELDREKTYGQGALFGYNNANGMYVKLPEGESFVLNFEVKRSGWYRLEVTGTSQSLGGDNNFFVDDTHYMGHVDFTSGQIGMPWATQRQLNTVWLDAGIHFIRMQAVTEGSNELGWYRFHSVEDPGQVQMELSVEEPVLAGQSVSLNMKLTDENESGFFLINRGKAPSYTNYYSVTSSEPSVLSVSGSKLNALRAGTAVVTVTAQINGETVTKELPVTVEEGTIASAELLAERTTFKPQETTVPLTFTAYAADGSEVAVQQITYTTSDASIADVDETGLVTVKEKIGSALITAAVMDGDREITAEIWITVTEGKTEPTLYTMEERANAQENVLKYDWAWQQKENAVRLADYYVENLDLIYNMWIREGLPRNTQVGFESDPNYRFCRYCGVDLVGIYSHYPWIVDPIENPWKITCPVCRRDFPSNDFESYYKSGLDEQGYFHKENADPQYLVNELYPEKGEGWGVDDGWGYKAEDGTHTYINYYLQVVFRSMSSKHGMNDILPALAEAYMFTGDEKYGSAGAILLDRMADIYPEYDYGRYSIANYANSDGGNGCGRIVGAIWEADHIGPVLSQAVDAFWPAMDNPDVIEYLRSNAAFKGVAAEDITPEYVRENAVNGILLELIRALYERDCYGNPGMQQEVAATVAVVLDREPETPELIDWLYETSVVTGDVNNFHNSGGDLNRLLVEDVCRDGFGYEVSYLYNSLWPLNLIYAAEALSDYDKVEGASLWENQKYVNMFTAMTRLSVCGRLMAQTGEAGAVQSQTFSVVPDDLITAFVRTENVEVAQCLYFANGNKVDGLHADIFTKDPESGLRDKIQQIINTYGEFDTGNSNMMSGFGIAILREGPSKYLPGVNDHAFSDYWMYFGRSGGTGHEKYDALAIDLEGFGIGLSSTMGYPMRVVGGDPEREQWVRNTTSHNTVVVNDQGQSKTYGGFPMHFEDAGSVKVMDAENSAAYPETDIYRRTLVTVAAPNGVHYAVDFFRVLGGSEHVYSFHAAGNTDPAVQGLDLIEQPMGTYAGADIPFGAYYEAGVDGSRESRGGGYSWLKDVWRDDSPENTFSLDWEIRDFHNRLSTTSGIHLRLTMLSDEPMTEVAIADAVPPQNGTNPDHLEYALVRRSGEPGMDTLFTTIIEPYQYAPLIASAELVDVRLVQGSETAQDRAAAIKTTLVTGRVDYIIYATNPDCTYEIDGTFSFRGFAGVVSYENGILTYAWGSEAELVTNVIEHAQARVTGQVESFTEGIEDRYYLTVTMDSPVCAQELTGRYIYVNNDGERNAAYRIYDAEVSGNTAVLDLYSQTLVREYVDELNLDLGFKHNIAVGQTYSIPLSAEYDMASLVNYIPDQVVKAGYRVDLQVGVEESGVAYEAEGLVKGMKINASTGKLTWTTSK
ncbi:MAG: Ig-like domain-containing protein, partial [Oscillospiraceae bacterium]|nr:Ig-like domain-containing protein [Oscillospiraceae bacterium]